MKKFIFGLIAFIAILGAVIVWKNSMKTSTTVKYYDADIRELIVRGSESMHGADNVSYEFENDMAISKHYVKGNKSKMETLKAKEGSSIKGKITEITDLDEGKQYLFDESSKIGFIQKTTSVSKSIQHGMAEQIKASPTTNSSSRVKIEYHYVTDEVLEEKDCIVVEEQSLYRMDDGSYVKDSERSTFYWIEESTGYIVALGGVKEGNNTPTPENFIRNISIGTVKDSDFEHPTGYTIVDKSK